MVDARDIGLVRVLEPHSVTAAALGWLEYRIDELAPGIYFHCARCNEQRTAVFEPHILCERPRTCQDALWVDPCTAETPRKPVPSLGPGELVTVQGLPDPSYANWPGIIEDDPYGRSGFKLNSHDTQAYAMAYWVTLIAVDDVYRGGWIRPENLLAFKPSPSNTPPDASRDFKSAMTQATVAYHFHNANRLKMFSFVARACLLSRSNTSLRQRLAKPPGPWLFTRAKPVPPGGGARRLSAGRLPRYPSQDVSGAGPSGSGAARVATPHRSPPQPLCSYGQMTRTEFLELFRKNCREYGEDRARDMYPVACKSRHPPLVEEEPQPTPDFEERTPWLIYYLEGSINLEQLQIFTPIINGVVVPGAPTYLPTQPSGVRRPNAEDAPDAPEVSKRRRRE